MGESYNKFATGGLFVTYPIHYNISIIFLNKYPLITLVNYSDDTEVFVGGSNYEKWFKAF